MKRKRRSRSLRSVVPIRTCRLALVGLVLAAGLLVAIVLPLLPLAVRGAWSRALLVALGVRLEVSGERPRRGGCLIVANHVSWLDVIAISAIYPDACFVCKLEIASWPLLGWLLKRAGTFFMRRGSAFSAWRAVQAIAPCVRQGARVAVFPEGTTTPGDTLLPFHAALFQSAVNAGCAVQPVALAYSSSAAAYTGETAFGESLLAVAGADGLSVSVEFPRAFPASGITRREAAQRAREAIVSCLRHLEVAESSQPEPMLRAA